MESVEIASWMEEEDGGDTNGMGTGSCAEGSGIDHQHRSSAPLHGIIEFEEEQTNLDSYTIEGSSIPENGKTFGSPTSAAEHSTDSGSSSEVDIAEFQAKMERVDSSDMAMLVEAKEEYNGPKMVDAGSNNPVSPPVTENPICSPPSAPLYSETWASVSSCTNNDTARSPISPIMNPYFKNDGKADVVDTQNLPEDLPNKCGFLLKRGFVNTAYKLRYFKVDYNSLVFFKKSSDTVRRGSIFCAEAIVDKRRGDALDPRTPFAFTLTTPHDPYHKLWTLQATSERERDEWILVINFMAALPLLREGEPGTLVGSPSSNRAISAAVGKATCCIS